MTLTNCKPRPTAWPIDRLHKVSAKLRLFERRLVTIGFRRVVPWASLSSRAVSHQRNAHLYMY